jgi:hypothetical protein
MSSSTEGMTRPNREGANGMSSSTEEITRLRDELKGVELAQAAQTATLAGAQATQAAAHAGTWSTMLAGAAGLITGMFLAVAIVRTKR